MTNEKKRLIIIDSNAVIHRAYHALPDLTTKKGDLVNAVYGFLLVFFKVIKEFEPDYIIACFDFPGPTFRHKKFVEYKAKRKKAPQDLYDQIPRVKEILGIFGVPVFEKQGFEADDLIATVAVKSPQQQVLPEIENIIVSGDLDTLQLVNKNTKVYNLAKGIKKVEIYDDEKVMEKFGILPSQVVDFKALSGDPSDNIPGATGIGKKTAVELLKEYKTIEQLYSAIEKGEAWDINSKIKETLLKYKAQVFFSYELAEARKDSPIDFNLEKCKWKKPSLEPEKLKKIDKLFRAYDFYSLINRIP